MAWATRASAVINPGAPAVGALRTRAGLQPGESVLINGGTGITGRTAVQIAKHLGAGRVAPTGRNAKALARLVEVGADHIVDLSAEPGTVRAELEGQTEEVDVVLDYLSGPPAAQRSGGRAQRTGRAGLRWWTGAGQRIVYPPSTRRSVPLIMSAASDAR